MSKTTPDPHHWLHNYNQMASLFQSRDLGSQGRGLAGLPSGRTLKVGQSLWPPFCFETPLSKISPPFA